MAYVLIILVLAVVGLALGLSPILAVLIAIPLFGLFLGYVVLAKRREAMDGVSDPSEAAAKTDDGPPQPPIA
jgi:hypothetical protein